MLKLFSYTSLIREMAVEITTFDLLELGETQIGQLSVFYLNLKVLVYPMLKITSKL